MSDQDSPLAGPSGIPTSAGVQHIIDIFGATDESFIEAPPISESSPGVKLRKGQRLIYGDSVSRALRWR